MTKSSSSVSTCTSGSQISQLAPYESGPQAAASSQERDRAWRQRVKLSYLDMGGGLAVSYEIRDDAIDIAAFGKPSSSCSAASECEFSSSRAAFWSETPGPLTRVLYRKAKRWKELHHHRCRNERSPSPVALQRLSPDQAVSRVGLETIADVVGPVCESGDFFALDRQVDDVVSGDLLAVHSAGLYGFVMASNYNSARPAARSVGGRFRFAVVTERETMKIWCARKSRPRPPRREFMNQIWRIRTMSPRDRKESNRQLAEKGMAW